MTDRATTPLSQRILATLERVPAGLTKHQLVLALGYAETSVDRVEEALLILLICGSIERYHRSIPGDVVLVWQHQKFTAAQRLLIVTQEAA